jgi:hypothetical protein
VAIIKEFEVELRSYMSNVDQFSEAALGIFYYFHSIKCIAVLGMHHQFGEALKILYDECAFKFYIQEVTHIL